MGKLEKTLDKLDSLSTPEEIESKIQDIDNKVGTLRADDGGQDRIEDLEAERAELVKEKRGITSEKQALEEKVQRLQREKATDLLEEKKNQFQEELEGALSLEEKGAGLASELLDLIDDLAEKRQRVRYLRQLTEKLSNHAGITVDLDRYDSKRGLKDVIKAGKELRKVSPSSRVAKNKAEQKVEDILRL